ncbi:MAG TPA: hypothetical protein VKX28_27800 [Xanthobacteraceae bacterium]|nr:hypothetical protein [Xanthobacteraceae bacterium]
MTAFPSWTRGFTAKDEPAVAVCLRPGTELAFAEEVDWDRPFRIFRRKPEVGKLARFRQVNVHNPHTHHDAIEFPDGRVVLLTRLLPGQRVTVVQLPVERPPAPPSRPIERAPELIPTGTNAF